MIVESVVETEQTTITPPSSPAWILPFWARSFAIHPSPDGEFVLVSSPGANLLSWDGNPDATVLRLYRAPGDLIAAVPLRSIMQPEDMQHTASHYAWIIGYVWSENGWLSETPDGQNWHLGTNLSLNQR